MSRILVLAEHQGATLTPATLSTVTAAEALGDVTVLIAGTDAGAAAETAATINGVSEVLVSEDAAYTDSLAEPLAALVLANLSDATHILAPADTFGKNVLPRLGALLDVQPVTDVIAIDGPDTFKRPIYAGNAVATVRATDPIKILTIRPTAFPLAEAGGDPATIADATPADAPTGSTFVSRDTVKSDRPELTAADVVISGGRGVGSKDGFAMIEALAGALDGAVGATRAAVDAGYAPNDWQVGQTGKMVAPKLYVAVGLSGAIQHLAGMKDSGTIIAINTDEDAPIFKVADYGLVADLHEAVPALTAALKTK